MMVVCSLGKLFCVQCAMMRQWVVRVFNVTAGLVRSVKQPLRKVDGSTYVRVVGDLLASRAWMIGTNLSGTLLLRPLENLLAMLQAPTRPLAPAPALQPLNMSLHGDSSTK